MDHQDGENAEVKYNGHEECPAVMVGNESGAEHDPFDQRVYDGHLMM